MMLCIIFLLCGVGMVALAAMAFYFFLIVADASTEDPYE